VDRATIGRSRVRSYSRPLNLLEERVLGYFGLLKCFHFDNGREFVNLLIRAMFDRWEGDVTFVSGRPRHSQSQGLVKRGNRTVEDRLKAVKKEEGLLMHRPNKRYKQGPKL